MSAAAIVRLGLAGVNGGASPLPATSARIAALHTYFLAIEAGSALAGPMSMSATVGGSSGI